MDCLTAAVFRFHQALLSVLESENISSTDLDLHKEHISLANLVGFEEFYYRPKELFLELPILLDLEYVCKVRQILGKRSLRLLLDCASIKAHQYFIPESVSFNSSFTVPILSLTTTLLALEHNHEFLELLVPTINSSLFQQSDITTMLANFLEYIKLLLFFIRIDPSSRIATICFKILQVILHKGVSKLNIEAFSPFESSVLLQAFQQVDLVRLTFCNKGGVRFIRYLVSMLSIKDQLLLLSQLDSCSRTTYSSYTFRRLKFLAYLCQATTRRQHICAAHLPIEELLEFQKTLIRACFSPILQNNLENVEKHSGTVLSASLSCIIKIIFARLAPHPIDKFSGSIRTVYRVSGFLYALEQILALLENFSVGLPKISLVLSFYIQCAQRFTNLRHNLSIYRNANGRKLKLITEEDLDNSLLNEKLTNITLNILSIYLKNIHVSTEIDHSSFVKTLVSILYWSPVPMSSILDLFLEFLQQKIEHYAYELVDISFILSVSTAFVQICLSIGSLTRSPWHDRAEACNIKALITTVFPFIYTKYVPFLQQLLSTISDAHQDQLQLALQGLLEVCPMVFRNLTHELTYPVLQTTALYSVSQEIHDSFFNDKRSTSTTLVLANFLNNLFSISWTSTPFLPALNTTLLRLLCETLASLIEFCYIPTLRLGAYISTNVLLEIYKHTTQSITPYGPVYITSMLLSMLSQYMALGHFTDKRYHLVAFLQAGASLDVLEFLENILRTNKSVSSPDTKTNFCVILLMLLREILSACNTLISEFSNGRTECYLRRYDFKARGLLTQTMALFQTADNKHAELIQWCLILLCTSSTSCYILPGSLFQTTPLVSSSGSTKRIKRTALQIYSSCFQVDKWIKLKIGEKSFFQTAFFDILLQDLDFLQEPVSASFVFLLSQSFVLRSTSSHYSSLFLDACLDHLYLLSTGAQTPSLCKNLDEFLYSCACSGETHTIRTIADFIVKSHFLSKFFASSEGGSKINIHILSRLLKQSDSYILHTAVARYLLKQFSGALPDCYLLTSRRRFPEEESSLINFVTSFSILFQMQLQPQIDQSYKTPRKSVKSSGTEVIVPGNSFTFHAITSPFKRAHKTLFLKQPSSNVFTYLNRRNIYSITLTFMASAHSNGTGSPLADIFSLSIRMHDSTLACSATVSSSIYTSSTPLTANTEWVYVEIRVDDSSFSVYCCPNIQEGLLLVLNAPLQLEEVSSGAVLHLKIDAIVQLLGLEQAMLDMMRSTSHVYIAQVYPICTCSQIAHDKQYFLRSQAPTFTWTHAESTGYIFIMYDDSDNVQIDRAVLPQDSWIYDVNGVLQALSLLLLSERPYNRKIDSYEARPEFELNILLKLLHMLQDTSIEESFQRICGYKLLLSYFCTLQWQFRMQSLYIIIRYLQFLLECSISEKQEVASHLFYLATKLYHELVIIPVASYFPDTSLADQETENQWTHEERTFYTALFNLHYTVFKDKFYTLTKVEDRTTPICFLMYHLVLSCIMSSSLSYILAPDEPHTQITQLVTLIHDHAQTASANTIMLVHLLKCLSLPIPIFTPQLADDLITLIYDLYVVAMKEDDYVTIKTTPVIADLYLHEKILLLTMTLRLEQANKTPILTCLLWKEWVQAPCAFQGLFVTLLQVSKANEIDLAAEEFNKNTVTTLCSIGDFFALLFSNLLIIREYPRYKKVLLAYTILPILQDSSTCLLDQFTDDFDFLQNSLGKLNKDMCADYLPITTGLLSLSAIVCFTQILTNAIALSNFDIEKNEQRSHMQTQIEVLSWTLSILVIILEKLSIEDLHATTMVSVISFLHPTFHITPCAHTLVESVHNIINQLHTLDSDTIELHKSNISTMVLHLNNYFKASAEQLHKKIDVLHASASIDVLPFSVNVNLLQRTRLFPKELLFHAVGNIFGSLLTMENTEPESGPSDNYVCSNCMSKICFRGLSLSMLHHIYGVVCHICGYRPTYKHSKSSNAGSNVVDRSFADFVTLEMMNSTRNRIFSTTDQIRSNSHPKSDIRTKSERPESKLRFPSIPSATSSLFYQKLLYSKEIVAAYFMRPHSIYRPVYNLSSQKLIILSPLTFSYPSVRMSPNIIHSDVNMHLGESCLTDIGGALQPLNYSNLRQYDMVNNPQLYSLIEFGEVLLISLTQTGCGVLHLRVSSDISEKQGPLIGEEVVITSRRTIHEPFPVADDAPNFTAGAGMPNQALFFNASRFDQRSDSDDDSTIGSFQHPDDSTSIVIKEHQEMESFAIMKRLLCYKDNPRSIHLTDSFTEKQDGFGRRITYGIYDYSMSSRNKAYQRYKEVEISIEFSRILYMIPLFFLHTQPALQVLDANGGVYLVVFKTREHAIKVLYSYGCYRRFRVGDTAGSAYGTNYYYAKSPYRKKGILLDFESIVTTFQSELLASLRSLINRRILSLTSTTAHTLTSLTIVKLSVFTILSSINLIAGRSPIASYIYSIFPAISPHKLRRRNLRYSLPAQSSMALCKSIIKYAELSLGDLQNSNSSDKAAISASITFLNEILEQCTQILNKSPGSTSSTEIITLFRNSLDKVSSSSSALKFLSANPLFRTFVSNNMTLPYYCFSIEPFTSLQRNLQSGCLDAFSRLFIGLRTHWEKVEIGSTFHEAVPELFYTPYPFMNANNLQLSSDAEAISGILQSTPSQAMTIINSQRTALEYTLFSDHSPHAGLRSWLELIFGDKQQSLDSVNLFPNSTVECSPSEASIATSLFFGTYPARLPTDEMSKLLLSLENVHLPVGSPNSIAKTHSIDIKKRLVAIPFEPLTPGLIQDVASEPCLIFRQFHEPAICVAGKHFVQSNHVAGMLWTTKDCTIVDTFMIQFDYNKQEIHVFELSPSFLEILQGTLKGVMTSVAGGSVVRDADTGGDVTQDSIATEIQQVFSTYIVILGFVVSPGSRPLLLTNIPIGQLAKQGKSVGTYITTFKLATSLSRGHYISKNVIIQAIENVGYMPFYGYMLQLYTNHSIIIAGMQISSNKDSSAQLSVIQHYILDIGYYSSLIQSKFLHVPSLSLVCNYSSHVIHIMEYSSLHRNISYGLRDTSSPYLLTKLRLSYDENITVTCCAIHEKQGFIAVGLTTLDTEAEQTLSYSIYLYNLASIHLKAIQTPVSVESVLFFGGYDDGFNCYMLVNKRYVYALSLDTSVSTKVICEANILADSLATIDGAIVGYQRCIFTWYG